MTLNEILKGEKMKEILRKINYKDLVPALAGLIGKISLVASFAVIWAQELGIENANFVFDNVRLEIFIGGVIALLTACISSKMAPAGTLAPLVVLIPSMVKFGVHPLILSVLVGIVGLIAIKTGLLNKIMLMSGYYTKTSLTLVFGISGVWVSWKNIYSSFGNRYVGLFCLMLILIIVYVALLKLKKSWLMIPIAAIVSILLPLIFGMKIDVSPVQEGLILDPLYWWNEVWGVGLGINVVTILKTLPFALFVMLLWAMDTVAITTLLDDQATEGEEKEEIDINKSFVLVAIRNMIGGILGGAQTASLWRSFLIPLVTIKRPMRGATILLSFLCIVAGILGTPIKILSFTPLVWTVLLFGIFMPLTMAGINKLKEAQHSLEKGVLIFLTFLGIVYSPIITWIGSILFEKGREMFLSKREDEKVV